VPTFGIDISAIGPIEATIHGWAGPGTDFDNGQGPDHGADHRDTPPATPG